MLDFEMYLKSVRPHEIDLALRKIARLADDTIINDFETPVTIGELRNKLKETYKNLTGKNY